MHRRLLAMALLVATILVGVRKAGAQFASATTPDSLQAKIADLKSAPPLPKNEALLYQELNSIQADEARYRPLVTVQSDRSAAETKALAEVRSLAQSVIGMAASANCKTDAAKVMDQANQLRLKFATLSFKFDLESDNLGSLRYPGANDAERCSAFKSALTLPTQAALMADIDRMAKDAEEQAKKATQVASLAKQVVDLLAARKADVEKQIQSISGQQSARQSLPYVIGLIGMLSIFVLLVVRLFPIELQIEWINSGQVIQFVTVMVLLSVIMALGLAGIITENTLGTLLGGIAGYVLSQGVGRAAAREVTRSVLASQEAARIVPH